MKVHNVESLTVFWGADKCGQRYLLLLIHTNEKEVYALHPLPKEKKDNVPLLSTSSAAGGINKSWFGFTGLHSTCIKCHHAPKQSQAKNLISFLPPLTIAEPTERDLCVCDRSCICFMLLPLSLIFSLIHKQPWSVGSPSIHLPLHLQLISALKIYRIISGGASPPSNRAPARGIEGHAPAQ